MQLSITLNSEEVTAAIAEYLKDIGIDTEGKALDVAIDSNKDCVVTLTNQAKRRKRRTPAEMAEARAAAKATIAELDKEESKSPEEGLNEEDGIDMGEEPESTPEPTEEEPLTEPADTQSLFK